MDTSEVSEKLPATGRAGLRPRFQQEPRSNRKENVPMWIGLVFAVLALPTLHPFAGFFAALALLFGMIGVIRAREIGGRGRGVSLVIAIIGAVVVGIWGIMALSIVIGGI